MPKNIEDFDELFESVSDEPRYNPFEEMDALYQAIVDWKKDPLVKPDNQNKYFFSDGKTYYEQICKILKILSTFDTAFNTIYADIDDLAEQIQTGGVTQEELEEAISTLQTLLQGEIDALDGRLDTAETNIGNLQTLTSTHTSQITTINTAIGTIETSLASKIGDAPSDGHTYGRKNGAWTQVTGGGGGGTTDYDDLSNKPQINGNTLSGNKTGSQLGLVDTGTLSSYVAKADAPGYADILTQTSASSTYQTQNGMSSYVSKAEAPGYGDILTQTSASSTYQTQSGMSSYVSKTEAPGYADILTQTSASSTYTPLSNGVVSSALLQNLATASNNANYVQPISSAGTSLPILHLGTYSEDSSYNTISASGVKISKTSSTPVSFNDEIPLEKYFIIEDATTTEPTRLALKLGSGLSVNNSDEIEASDTKVTQTYVNASGYSYWRPLVVGNSSGATEGFTPTTKTDTCFVFKTIQVKPVTGTIRCGNLHLYNGNNYVADIVTDSSMSANQTFTLPSTGGTFAMTSDIPANELPSYTSTDAGKSLTVNSSGNGVEWSTVSGGGMTINLLWTNSTPTTAFSPQTIQLDISGYDLFYIAYRRSNTLDQYGINIAFKGMTCTFYDVGTIFRTANPKSDGTGITFDNGYVGSSVNNAYAIPYQVYGIK